MFRISCALVLIFLFSHVHNCHAILVTLDLTDPSGANGTAGEAFELGVTFSVSGLVVEPVTFPLVDSYRANTTQGGVLGGADDNRLDSGETFTLSFSGTPAMLVSVDLNLVGASDDSALVNVDGELFELHTGASLSNGTFNGTSDLWELSTPLAVTDLSFTADVQIGLQAVTVEIAAIPEPPAFLFGGVLCGVLGLRHARKSKSA